MYKHLFQMIFVTILFKEGRCDSFTQKERRNWKLQTKLVIFQYSQSIWKEHVFLIAFCQNNSVQKQLPRGVLKKRCSENMRQIYRRTSMPECSPVNLLHIFRTPFPRNTSEWLFLNVACGKAIVWNSVFWPV